MPPLPPFSFAANLVYMCIYIYTHIYICFAMFSYEQTMKHDSFFF